MSTDRKRIIQRAGLVFLTCSLAASQPLTFEVASIKASAPRPAGVTGTVGCYGGPGSSDPGRYKCSNVTVSMMAFQAYDLKNYQLSPAASTGETFDVIAKVPPDATAQQVKSMLQNLLHERFKLAFHYEKKDMQAYDLVVAKSGSKLKESEASTSPPASMPIIDADGFSYIPRRNSIQIAMANGLTRWAANSVGLDLLATWLNMVGRPVFNSTGLIGKYDFTLTFDSASAGGAGAASETLEPAIFDALQIQLGLQLKPTKRTVDIFAIDYAEKTPIEN